VTLFLSRAYVTLNRIYHLHFFIFGQTWIQDLLIQDQDQDQDQDSEVQDQNQDFDIRDQDRDSRLTIPILKVHDWDGL